MLGLHSDQGFSKFTHQLIVCVIAYDGFKYINRLLNNSYKVHSGLRLEHDPLSCD